MSKKRKFNPDAFLYGGLVAAIVIGGALYIYKQQKLNKNLGKSNQKNAFGSKKKDPYGPESIRHVANKLIKFKKIQEIRISFQDAKSIELDGYGGFYVSGNKGVLHYDNAGKESVFIKTKEAVRFILLYEKQLYCCIKSRIEIYDLEAKKVDTLYHRDSSARLTALAINKKYIFAADNRNKCIWRFDKEKDELIKFGTHTEDRKNGFIIPGPWMDLELRKDGILFASNPGRHNVNGYTEDGVLEIVLGKPSFRHDGFNGCCNPVAIACLDDMIVSSEKGISRVKLTNMQDEFVSIVAAPKDFKENKRSFVVDLQVDEVGKVYTLISGLNKVFVYEKKEKLK
ncbi:MAG: hypothetical protein HRT89_19450 [Lentisphaeria bacterium]|nr:hypothetical protein [Lentisphaeria bacterium]NQZ70233.1 hypothetical protein [Lentisphaeria bacterium]